MNTKYFNHELSADEPISIGDQYHSQDRLRDFYNQREMTGIIAKAITNKTTNMILNGCYVTQGAGHTVNVTAGNVLVDFLIKTPTNWTTVAPPMSNQDVPMVAEISALTNQSIVGVTADGATTNYLKVAYAETAGSSRTRVIAGGSYNSEVTPSYTLTADDTAPTAYETAISTFTTDGATITFLNGQRLYKHVSTPTGYIKYGGLEVATTDNLIVKKMVIDLNGILVEIPEYNLEFNGQAAEWYAIYTEETTAVTAFTDIDNVSAGRAGNQLDMYTLYDDDLHYCRNATKRIFAVVYFDGTNFTHIIQIDNVPKSFAICNSNTAQEIATGASEIFDFEDIVLDINSNVAVGAAWKFTASASVSGKYLYNTFIGWATENWAAGKICYMDDFINGVQNSITAHILVQAALTAQELRMPGNNIVSLPEGSYFDIRVYQNTGIAIDTKGNAINQWITITEV